MNLAAGVPRSLSVVLATVVLLVMTACGSGNSAAPQSGGSPTPSAGSTITVTDIQGRQVELKAPVQRMFLGESRLLYLTAILDRDNPVQHIVGWPSDLKQTDPDTYNAYAAKFPEISNIPEIGALSKGAFSAEKVIDLKPDVIVLSNSAYKAAQEIGAVETLEKVGIPTVVIDFRDHPLETTAPSVELLGKILGQEQRATEFATYYNTQIDMVRQRVTGLEPKPLTFLYRAAGVGDCCGTFGSSNLGSMIELAGGRNLGTELLPGESGSLAEEQIFASNPDQIIVTGSNWKNQSNAAGYVNLGYEADEQTAREQLKKLMEQPGWSGLKAVQNGQVHGLWHQFYGAPYNFIAAIQIAKWQHPDEFSDVDPTAMYKEFHEKFLPIPFSGTFWVTL